MGFLSKILGDTAAAPIKAINKSFMLQIDRHGWCSIPHPGEAYTLYNAVVDIRIDQAKSKE